MAGPHSIGHRRATAALSALALAATAVALACSGGAAAAPASTSGTAALAYVTGTAQSTPAVWVANARGGEARRLGVGEDPLISPDGRWVAASQFGAEGSPALALFPASGAPASTYLSLGQVYTQPLAWSPDSRYVAVAVSAADATEAARSTLDLLDTATGALTVLAHGEVQGASFAPDGSDRVVYGLSSSLSPGAAVNLYVTSPDGSGTHALTSNGRSLNPVWGARGIVFDRERPRRLAPEYQLWLMPAAGGAPRALPRVRVAPLLVGLVPIAVSSSGSRLLAEFEGEDTSEAWTVSLSPRRARPLTLRGHFLMGAGISSGGGTVLVDEDALESPPSSGRVATVPFGGGRARVLVPHGAGASWNL